MIEIIKVPDFKAFAVTFASKRKDFYAAAMFVVVQDIVGHIAISTDITGHSYPALEPETVALKGHSKPLIDKGLLGQAGTYDTMNDWQRGQGIITIKAVSAGDKPRDQVGRELQIDGINSKRGKKFFPFFGISADAVKTIKQIIEELIQESLEAM